MHRLGGRFVLVLLGETPRVYLDAGGSLAAVYDTRRSVVASTPDLITSEADEQVADALGRPPAATWYPFGITSAKGVERLLPNHYLDLQTWEQVRHWSPPTVREGGERDRAAEIARIIRRNIVGMAGAYPLTMSLTAGRDSRMLLACARPVAEDVLFFTRTIDAAAEMDARFAGKLAAKLGLRHRTLPFERSSAEELAAWQERTGHSVSGRWWESYRAIKRLPQGRMFLPGLGVEVGRAYYWRPEDRADAPLDAATILARLKMPDLPFLRERAEVWLRNAPDMDRFGKLDLLYLEQRMGGWAGPLHYGLVDDGLCLSPAVDRRIYDIMLGLPTEYRRSQQLAVDVIASSWPELLSYPFNRPNHVTRARRSLGKTKSMLKRFISTRAARD